MKITLEQARRLTKKVVAESRPGTVLWCQYTMGGGPHCIVAVVLAEAGVMYETIDDLVGAVDDATVRARLACDDVHITERAIAYLHRAQYTQDRGLTWERALEEAEAMITDRSPRGHAEFVARLSDRMAKEWEA
jgi:hypothetical protein